MGLLGRLLNTSLKFIATILVVTFIPGLPPHMEFEAYSVTPPQPLKGTLAINGKLNNAEKLFVDEIKGPEHMEVHNDILYTSLIGGYVAKIVGEKIVPVVKFGKKCDGLYEPEICGRPLGLSFDSKGFLYVADAYYGVFKVNVSSGKYDQLVSMNTEINGKVPKLPNSVTVAKDGFVYWSDSSTFHHLHDGLYSFLGNGNGRLIKYDPETKSNTVLIDKLVFANGVALSKDESFVVVCDLGRSRILRYHLKGPKKGETEVFVDGLPGFPDNIHSNKKGEFQVTLAMNADNDNPSLTSLFAPHPIARRLMARLLYIIEYPALQLNKYYPSYYSKVFAHWIGSFSMLPSPRSSRVTIVFFNEEGKITRSLHATDGKISTITDMALWNGYYYLGSFTNSYLARVKAS